MATRNPDSLDKQGPFHARVPPSQPMVHKWHHPGNEQGKDRLPEFHAETYPPGTAPPESTFLPNPIHEIPGQANNPDMHPECYTHPLESWPGARDRDIYNETDYVHGHPLEGQRKRELHGKHPCKRKKERCGLEGVGATHSKETVEAVVRAKAADKEGVVKGLRGKSGALEGGLNWPGAEDLPPVPAEQLHIRPSNHED